MGYLRIIDVDNDYYLWTIEDAKDVENYIKHKEDKLIEKAKKWLYLQLNEINMEGEEMENFLKDFRNYMKGY